jgi:hypothetical protein
MKCKSATILMAWSKFLKTEVVIKLIHEFNSAKPSLSIEK